MKSSLNTNKMRLKWKIFAFLLGFCTLLLIFLWLFQTVFLIDTYKFIRKRELDQVIATVEREIDNPDLQTILFEIQEEKDIVIAPTRDFVPPQRSAPEAHGRRIVDFETITETRELTRRNDQTISLTFYARIAPVSATVSTLRMQLYVVTLTMLTLSVLLAIVIAKRVSKPIEDISRSALILSKGDFDTRFEGKGYFEIAALSDTLNKAAAELRKVEGLRRELLANVSHDLRTPLALIYSYAEMMCDFPGEITQDHIKVIMDETRRLTTLVNDVLDVSKLESDMDKLNISDLNLTKSILGTTLRIQELLKNEGFYIIFQYDRDVYVKADETKIGRAFYNLLINAINYSGGNRDVTVAQTVSGGRVRISITDCGEGISKDDLPFIWDRYYKSSKKHKRAVTGTGLGLSIVRKIIELHGGSYGVISDIGKGSTFWFELTLT